MQSLTGKITGSALTAAEWNELPQEVQNIITAWGQSLSTGDLDQAGKGMAAYAAASQFYTGGGGPVNYTATKLSGIQAPPDYFTGMVVRFRPSATNTGAATVNVDSLGQKDIKKEDGTALIAGEMDTDRDAWLVYDGTNFLLSNWSATATPVTPVTPQGHLSGLVTSRVSDSVFQIIAGSARNLADDTTLILPSTFTKSITAGTGWTAGSGGDARPTGVSLTSNAPYHMFVIHEISSGDVDIGMDTSISAANLLADSGYDNFRRVGDFRLDGTSDIINYRQVGDYFARYSDFAGVAWTGTSQVFDNDDLFVPNDFRVLVTLSVTYFQTGGGFGWIYPGDNSRNASATSHNFGDNDGDHTSGHTVLTSATGTIDIDTDTTANAGSRLNTDGYWDRRGQDGVEPT